MGTRGTILVVDDAAAIADLLHGVLAGASYRVLVAPTVEIGLQVLRAFRVGLVLTDAFPSTSDTPGDISAGLDRLTRATGATPLILCAAGRSECYADHAAHGFAARLAKPFDLDGLLATVGALLPADGPYAPVAPAREG